MLNIIRDVHESVKAFAFRHLEEAQPRDNYRELLELTLIFLGAVTRCRVHFMSPGAMYHARWMSKMIYSFKVWMFRAQFKLTPREEKDLRDVCLCCAYIYIKAWYTSPNVVSAPHNDLLLMKSLLEYSNINAAISRVTTEKLSNHLWYLSESLVGLAFYDSEVSPSTKRKMVKAMKEKPLVPSQKKKASVPIKSFSAKSLEDFVTEKTSCLFRMMDLPDSFLEVDPELWADRDDFRQTVKVIHGMKLVNDHAERGVDPYSGIQWLANER